MLDRLLPRLGKLMSPRSAVLLLLVEENDPDDVASVLAAQGFSCRVAASRRAQNERLMVLAATRGGLELVVTGSV